MRVGEHLRKLHEHESEHHSELAKLHSAMAAKCLKLADAADAASDDDEVKDHHRALADGMHKVAEQHSAAAEYHKAACDGMSKAAGLSDDGDELEKLPEGISGVAPYDPRNLRAVPRVGGKALGGQETEMEHGELIRKVFGPE